MDSACACLPPGTACRPPLAWTDSRPGGNATLKLVSATFTLHGWPRACWLGSFGLHQDVDGIRTLTSCIRADFQLLASTMVVAPCFSAFHRSCLITPSLINSFVLTYLSSSAFWLILPSFHDTQKFLVFELSDAILLQFERELANMRYLRWHYNLRCVPLCRTFLF